METIYGRTLTQFVKDSHLYLSKSVIGQSTAFQVLVAEISDAVRYTLDSGYESFCSIGLNGSRDYVRIQRKKLNSTNKFIIISNDSVVFDSFDVRDKLSFATVAIISCIGYLVYDYSSRFHTKVSDYLDLTKWNTLIPYIFCRGEGE